MGNCTSGSTNPPRSRTGNRSSGPTINPPRSGTCSSGPNINLPRSRTPTPSHRDRTHAIILLAQHLRVDSADAASRRRQEILIQRSVAVCPESVRSVSLNMVGRIFQKTVCAVLHTSCPVTASTAAAAIVTNHHHHHQVKGSALYPNLT
jgi:hypothetical protein